MALDSVEFSDKEADEELASNFADIVTQMALDVSYPFRSRYTPSFSLLSCSFFLVHQTQSFARWLREC